MNNIIRTSDGSVYKKPDTLKTGTAIMAASGVQLLPLLVLDPISTATMQKVRQLNEDVLTVDIQNAMNKALEISEMKAKGVKIFQFSPKIEKTFDTVLKDFITKVDNILKHVQKPMKYLNPINLYNSCVLSIIKQGYNAGFSPDKNAVYINPKKMGTSVFHEIGHSINFNASKFWRGMQKMRLPFLAISFVLPAIALCKRKKAEGEKPQGIFDKTTTFIKDNVGKLTALSFVPIVLEEIMASVRGNKLAKQCLKPELVQKVVKTNRYGAITYISNGILFGVGAYLANKTKDAIASPKKVA